MPFNPVRVLPGGREPRRQSAFANNRRRRRFPLVKPITEQLHGDRTNGLAPQGAPGLDLSVELVGNVHGGFHLKHASCITVFLSNGFPNVAQPHDPKSGE